MTELLAGTCDVCGEPMLPNVSTLNRDGCLWICINPRCPERRDDEVEAEDLAEAGVPAGLAVRLARLLAFHNGEEADQHPSVESNERDLSRLRVHVLDMERMARASVDIANHLQRVLKVSSLSNDFGEAQAATQALSAAEALLATLGRTLADAASRLDTIDHGPPGSLFRDG